MVLHVHATPLKALRGPTACFCLVLLDAEHAGLGEAANRLLDAYEGGQAPALEALNFEPIPVPQVVPRVGAVDGGSCVLLDLVSCGVVAVRAAFTVRSPDDEHEDGAVMQRLHVVSRQDPEGWWNQLVAEFGWGQAVELPPPRGRQAMGLWADAARTLLEYDAARTLVRSLSKGDVLLLDGSLEGEDAGGGDLARSLAARARERGVLPVAVSKDSARSILGILPFPLEVEDRAHRLGVPGRFWVDVSKALGLLDRDFAVLAVRWAPSGSVFRVDVPRDLLAVAGELMGILGATANDPSVPGYPYPLARAHRRVRFEGSDVVDLRRAMEAMVSERRGARLGMRLFGRGRDVLDFGT
jgi:hypothetical protein